MELGRNPEELYSSWDVTWLNRMLLVRQARREARIHLANNHKISINDVLV